MPAHIIYARKSTESDDRQVLSIDSQINELRAIAMRRGIRVVEILTESRSAKAPGRPIFSELMRRVNKGSVQRILCWKMDRLARNHLDTGLVLQALADGKLTEVITSDRTYTRDGNDRFMGSFELGMATKYIDDLRANVKRGNRARFQRGWINHNPPLGYLMDPVTKTIVMDPKRFDLVRRMWDLLLDGSHATSRIMAIANEQWGFRTRKFKRIGGKPLARATFYKMFSNVFYTGLIRLRSGETFAGAHPPMVSREEYERAQELLGRAGRARPKHHQFAFTGILKCAGCGGGVTAEEHVKPSGRRYVYYHCSHHRSGVVCREPAIPERELERQILEKLRLLEMPEKILAWVCHRVELTFAADADRRRRVQETLAQSVHGYDRERENLLSLRLRDLVDDAAFVARKREIDERRERAEARLRSRGLPAEAVTDAALKTFRFAAKAAEIFVRGTPVQKRMILEATGLNYRLRSRKVLYELKNPLRIVAEAGACHNWWARICRARTFFRKHPHSIQWPSFCKDKHVSQLLKKKLLRRRTRATSSRFSSARAVARKSNAVIL